MLNLIAAGIGAAALSSLLTRDMASGATASSTALPGMPHFAPKAKRVIYLYQNGAPSHVDLFDYKPKLKEWHGKQIPDSVLGGKRCYTACGEQGDEREVRETWSGDHCRRYE